MTMANFKVESGREAINTYWRTATEYVNVLVTPGTLYCCGALDVLADSITGESVGPESAMIESELAPPTRTPSPTPTATATPTAPPQPVADPPTEAVRRI